MPSHTHLPLTLASCASLPCLPFAPPLLCVPPPSRLPGTMCTLPTVPRPSALHLAALTSLTFSCSFLFSVLLPSFRHPRAVLPRPRIVAWPPPLLISPVYPPFWASSAASSARPRPAPSYHCVVPLTAADVLTGTSVPLPYLAAPWSSWLLVRPPRPYLLTISALSPLCARLCPLGLSLPIPTVLSLLYPPPSPANLGELTSWQPQAHWVPPAASGLLPLPSLPLSSASSCDTSRMSGTTDALAQTHSAG